MPLEERKYKDINQFGEGDQAKVCVDIMHKTGAHLELSLAKDQGLSIMVSGKLDAVMKARKEIVSRLQTQVRRSVFLNDKCVPWMAFVFMVDNRSANCTFLYPNRLQLLSLSPRSTTALSSAKMGRNCRSSSSRQPPKSKSHDLTTPATRSRSLVPRRAWRRPSMRSCWSRLSR